MTITGHVTGRASGLPWPERKRWWRNLRDSGQVRLRLRGVERTGHAQAHGDEREGVTVTVQLDPPA